MNLGRKVNLPINREQRRTVEKKLKLLSNPKVKKESILEFWESLRDKEYLKPGTKVKLNVEKIKESLVWKSNNLFYHKFVNDNLETVFTLRNIENLEKKPVIFALEFPNGELADFWIHENDLEVVE